MLDSDPCQRDRPCPTTLFHYLALYCFCCCCCSVTKSCPILCDYLFCSMEKAMTPHSSTLAWKIPWAEEPGRLQSMGSRRVRHDWATSLSLFTFMHWRGKWQPTPVFLPGESQGRGSLVLQSLGSLRVGHDWAASLSLFTFHFHHWRRKWQPAPVFLPGESQGRGILVGCHLWGRTESDMTEATQQQHSVL